MEYFYYLTVIGQTYSCDAYGSAAYGECLTETETIESPAPTQPADRLADTGFDVIIPIALGLSIIIASAILLAKRLRRRSKNAK